MKKEKQICDFNIKKFNLKKRLSEIEGGPIRGKRPTKTTTTTSTSTTSTTTKPPQPPGPDPETSGIVYLEFYGTTVENTMWNTSGAMTMAHSGLTDEEITSVLEAVKLHYDGFNVIVTNDIDLFNGGTPGNRVKVIFTESYEWFGNNAGGVAYLNCFKWTTQESPAFVFTSLLSYNTHNIAEAGAHETGHTLGLRHQAQCTNGVVTNQYNWGDSISAPIMGASYNVPFGSWWIGPTPLGCDNIQDDRQMIVSVLGLL